MLSTARNSSAGRTLATALTGLLVLAAGCADDGIPKRYPVSGNVTYKGEPLARGSINFIPEAENGRGATGTIVGGRYSLTTHAPDDGAMPGKYKVTVTAYEGDLAKVQADADAALKTKGAMPDQVAIGKAQKKSMIPEKYGSFEGSGLSAVVEARSNSIPFDLKD